MSKNLYLCVPDPFDSSTGARLERMGILRPDGEVNVEVMVSSFGEDDSRVIEFDALVTMHYENGTWKIAGIE